MTVLARLESPIVDLVPGARTSTALTVRNNGELVEAFHIEVLGDIQPWTTVEPQVVSLYPGTEGQASLVFQPPRSSQVPAGEVPYAVRVIPSEHPDTAVVPEGVARVAPFTETTAEITPRTSKGRLWTRHEVAIDNRGNVPVRVDVSGTDPNKQLRFAARPSGHALPAGQAAFTKLKVRPRKLRWRGQPATHPFQAVVASDVDPPVVLDATALQVPLVPRATGRALAALAAIVALLLAAWFLLLKPAVESAAKQAVDEPLQLAQDQAAAADRKAEEARQGQGNGSGTAATPQVPPSQPPTVVSNPFATRLETAPVKNAVGDDSYVVPAQNSLVLTDIVLENPQGDTGRLDVVVQGRTLFTVSLANFRDIDYHFVSPIVVPAGQRVTVRTTCQQPGPRLAGTNDDRCRNWVILAGVQRTSP